MHSLVCFERVGDGEAHPAVSALVRLLSGVNPLVPLEINESGEGFPAVEADMRLLAGVDLLVLFEVVVP